MCHIYGTRIAHHVASLACADQVQPVWPAAAAICVVPTVRYLANCARRGAPGRAAVCGRRPMASHLVQGALRMLLDDLLQHPPVCARGELGDAVAALQI